MPGLREDGWNNRSRGFDRSRDHGWVNSDSMLTWATSNAMTPEARTAFCRLANKGNIRDDWEFDDSTNAEMVDYLDPAGQGPPSRIPSMQGRRVPSKAAPQQEPWSHSASDHFVPPKAKSSPPAVHTVLNGPAFSVPVELPARSRGCGRINDGPLGMIPPPPCRPTPSPHALPRKVVADANIPDKAPPPVAPADDLPRKVVAGSNVPKTAPPHVPPAFRQYQEYVDCCEITFVGGDLPQPRHGRSPSRKQVQFTDAPPSEVPSGSSGPIAVAALADGSTDDSEDADDSDDPGPPQSRQEPIAPIAVGVRFVYEMTYFDRMVEEGNWTSTYRQHNVAMKWYRGKGEEHGEEVTLFINTATCEVPVILKDNVLCPEDWSWDHTVPRNSWKWQELVAQLRREDMLDVVQGPGRRSRGIVCCRLQRKESYDHARHVTARRARRAQRNGPQMAVWNFYLERDDGSFCSLHPGYSNNKVAYKEGQDDGGPVALPRTGLGGSNGRGTYKFYKMQGVDKMLRFDGTKKPMAAAPVAAAAVPVGVDDIDLNAND